MRGAHNGLGRVEREVLRQPRRVSSTRGGRRAERERPPTHPRAPAARTPLPLPTPSSPLLAPQLVVSVKPDNLILPPGARATVVGLVSQPRWNGSTCKVVSFDRERRRYTVQMKDESTHLALKLENLVQVE